MTSIANILMLGDPHLGRQFTTGVPVHRRGEREETLKRDFEASLTYAVEKGYDMHVMMGDIFDKFVVAPEIVLWVSDLYNTAAEASPTTKFVLLRGNHDVSKNTDKRSSFDILGRLIESKPNIYVVEAAPQIIDGFGFLGFCEFTPLDDQIAMLADAEIDTIFTHHDFVDFGGNHVLPTQRLAEQGIMTVYNGHDHVRRTEERHGVSVHMVGSMQPYTHGEDRTGDLYVTVTLDELTNIDVTKKCVRVLLAEGETLPADVDCLALTAIRYVADEEEPSIDHVDFASLELRALATTALDGLSCKDELMGLFNAD